MILSSNEMGVAEPLSLVILGKPMSDKESDKLMNWLPAAAVTNGTSTGHSSIETESEIALQ